MENIINNIIKDINKPRKNTSNAWYIWYIYHNYVFNIHIKGYKTMDISVKDFNNYLFNSLKEGLNVTT